VLVLNIFTVFVIQTYKIYIVAHPVLGTHDEEENVKYVIVLQVLHVCSKSL
jgi:steroid 5-alpha reductase family enzyme